jgi:hypothetical protein
MRSLPDLRLFARLLLRIVAWLDDNFVRVFDSLKQQLPNASNVWLANTIVELAIEWTLKTI